MGSKWPWKSGRPKTPNDDDDYYYYHNYIIPMQRRPNVLVFNSWTLQKFKIIIFVQHASIASFILSFIQHHSITVVGWLSVWTPVTLLEWYLPVSIPEESCISTDNLRFLRSDDDKMFQLADKLVMAVSGEPGDTVQFAEFISKNIQLYKMRNGSASLGTMYTVWVLGKMEIRCWLSCCCGKVAANIIFGHVKFFGNSSWTRSRLSRAMFLNMCIGNYIGNYCKEIGAPTCNRLAYLGPWNKQTSRLKATGRNMILDLYIFLFSVICVSLRHNTLSIKF